MGKRAMANRRGRRDGKRGLGTGGVSRMVFCGIVVTCGVCFGQWGRGDGRFGDGGGRKSGRNGRFREGVGVDGRFREGVGERVGEGVSVDERVREGVSVGVVGERGGKEDAAIGEEGVGGEGELLGQTKASSREKFRERLSRREERRQVERHEKRERRQAENGIEEKKEAGSDVPKGARTTGRVGEFRGSLGGTNGTGMVRGQNVTRVSYTVYKILKLFGFASLTDVPAGMHSEWMSDMVGRLTYDVPSFRYVGVDEDAGGVEKAKKGMKGVVDGEFYVMQAEERLPNGTDVLLWWTELDGGRWDARGRRYVGQVARVMRVAKESGIGYVVFGQFPRLNGPAPAYRNGRWGFVGDEREEPFLFNEHVRGVVPTAGGAKSYMMYLTFYCLRSVPFAAIDAILASEKHEF